MPLIVPGVVLGASIYVFQIEAEIATTLPLLGTTTGLIAAHALIVIPWASRLVTGNYPMYAELEELLAAYKNTDTACIFGSTNKSLQCKSTSTMTTHITFDIY